MAHGNGKASRGRGIDLAARIAEACETSKYDCLSKFLPHGRIDDLVTETSITKTLRNGIRPNQRDEPGNLALARSILHNNAKTLFGIALLVGLRGHDLIEGMQQILDARFSDEDLPTTEEFWKSKNLLASQSLTESTSSDDEWTYQVWTPPRVQSFVDSVQWIFLAPRFSVDEPNHDLHPRHVLPFIELVAEYDSGAFGKVTAYKVHPSHLVDSNGQLQLHSVVAVKKIHDVRKSRQKIVTSWEKEAAILQQMNQLNQPHIVRFLTAFRHGTPGNEGHFLMLEWANGGNLRNLWKTLRRPSLTSGLVKETVHQVLGLAEAIKKAHYPESGPNFRHGDLKPENILWFGDDAIDSLKIGDWGLAKQHHLLTELRSKSTTTKDGTRAYEPPEEFVTHEQNLLNPNTMGKKKSRLYDMWAFGCITLEFLIWLVYGIDQLEKFNRILRLSNLDAPRFYQVDYVRGQPVAKVHDVVIRWMNHMAEDPIFAPGQTALGNLLEVVRNRLLVVKLPQRLGTSMDLSQDAPVPQQPLRIPSISRKMVVSPTPEAEPQTSILPGLPTVVIDAPGADPAEEKKTISRPEPKAQSPAGWERARANQLHDLMLLISGEDEEESYWFTGLPNPDHGPEIQESDQIVQKSKQDAEAFRAKMSKDPSSILSQINQVGPSV
ncbi:Serine/threonine-protein kinase dyf-5 [Colletotrichum tropicale]|nr:Serine/threonine-protein kinase dyf-5 [Colletotrichum tropicale]